MVNLVGDSDQLEGSTQGKRINFQVAVDWLVGLERFSVNRKLGRTNFLCTVKIQWVKIRFFLTVR